MRGVSSDSFYHHVNWSNFYPKDPLQSGIDVIDNGVLNSKGLSLFFWNGGPHEPYQKNQVTLVFGPGLRPALKEQGRDIYVRSWITQMYLTADPNFQGVVINGPSVPEGLRQSVSSMNQLRKERGCPEISLMTWNDFRRSLPQAS